MNNSQPVKKLEPKTSPVEEIGLKLGLLESEIEPYGKLKAKISLNAIKRLESNSDGKLILMTAMTPTPAGEGKTTTSIGLADAFHSLGENVSLCLREPSMGPVFGIKGGATGGGKSELVPMVDINLHFTGDMHAVTAAHNLLAALVANHCHRGNTLRLDPKRSTFRRVIDMNDRSLRNIVSGLGGPTNGIPRETGFDITASSEVMAALCLSGDIFDLKERLGNILIGYNVDSEPVYARDLKAHGAMAAILKDAIKPNLVQTRYSTPVFVHGGPFANIAHGCNSLTATKLALKLSDIVITEAGFATDLGAEKFFNIKCRLGNLKPSAAVIVATVRALKMHGGVPKKELGPKNLQAVKNGFENLVKHIENIKMFGVPTVVAVNKFSGDSQEEIDWILSEVSKYGIEAVVSDIYENGPEGGQELAHKVKALIETGKNSFDYLYPLEMPLKEKINVISRCCYGARDVTFNKKAKEGLALFEKLGYRNIPVCIAKTQTSLSDTKNKLGRPDGFIVTVKEVRLNAGAGFVVAIAGDIMTMPGLPSAPSAEFIDIDESGKVSGLF